MKKDALMLNTEKGDSWIWKVKEEGVIAAVASIGMTSMWDPENILNDINEYLGFTDIYTKAGACIAVGLCSTGVTSDLDPAKAILSEYLTSKEATVKLGAMIGLGLAYAGSAREEFLEDLTPLVVDTNISVEISAFAALTLGLIFVGKCNEDAINAIVETLTERPVDQLDLTISR